MIMKTRCFFLWAAMLLMAVGSVMAQDIEEKKPVSLNGVWQMCFYSSSLPDIPGELKTSNSLKILSDDGRFTNVVMMPSGAIVIGYGTYDLKSSNVFNEYVTRNIHLPQLNGQVNEMHFDLRENGDLMYVKYFVEKDIDGNAIESWAHEIWKRVEMPTKYPDNIVR